MPHTRLATLLIALNLIAITGFVFLPKSYTLLAIGSPRVLGESTQTQTVTYSLLEGWNLVHFPLKPTDFTTAAEIVKNIAQEGGYVTTIATWEDGAWKEYVQRGATAYSPDFPIESGKAYFLRSHQKFEWQVSGTKAAVTKLALKPGWNSIGVTLGPDHTAVNILDAINAPPNPQLPLLTVSPSLLKRGQGELADSNKTEQASEIDRWLSGTWQVFVKRIYTKNSATGRSSSGQNVQEYGDNFTLSEVEGYMLKANDYINLEIEN